MWYAVLPQPEQVAVRLIHAAVLATLVNIELVAYVVEILAAFLALPNLVE